MGPQFDGHDTKVRLHVRICMRKAMHAAMWGGALHYDQETSDNSAGQRVNYDRRSRVLVVFLSAIEGAEKAHSKHGYTYLGDEKDDGLRIMYFQDGTRTLSEDEVLYLYKKYC